MKIMHPLKSCASPKSDTVRWRTEDSPCLSSLLIKGMAMTTEMNKRYFVDCCLERATAETVTGPMSTDQGKWY